MTNSPVPRPPDWLTGTVLLLLVERVVIATTWAFIVISTMTVLVVINAVTTARHDHG